MRAKAKANPATARLSEKYGDARAKLSAHLSGELVGMLEDSVAIMDLAHRMDLGTQIADDPAEALGDAGKDIILTEEQKAKIAQLQTVSFKRQGDEARNVITFLKKDPAKIMEVILLRDAAKRGEITRAEYDSLSQGLDIPDDDLRLAFGGADIKDSGDDPVFLEELLRVLDEEQAKAYQEALAARQAAKPAEAAAAEEEFQTLEEFEKEISSGRQMMRGALQMMEGITNGGFQR